MDMMYPIHVLSNKKKCPHLAIHMECNVGGNANADCFHPSFHSDCHFRQKAERRQSSLEKKIGQEMPKGIDQEMAVQRPDEKTIPDKSNGLL